MTTVIQPFPFFADLGGDPLDEGYIYIGLPNQNPETSPKQAYWDAALSIPVTQQLRTLEGYIARNGAPARVFVNGEFSMTVRNKRGSLVYTLPSVDSFVTSADLALPGAAAGTGAVGGARWTQVQAALNYLSNKIGVDSAAALFADTVLTYATGSPWTVSSGMFVQTRREGFCYEVAASGASDHDVTTAGGVKLYVRYLATPHAFGCVDLTDSTAAFQKFLNAIAAREFTVADWTCDINLSSPVTITGSSVTFEPATKYWTGIATLRPVGSAFSASQMITLDYCIQVEWSGGMRLKGGGSSWASRIAQDGVRFLTCARMKISRIEAIGFRRYGLDFGAYNSAHGQSNKNMMTIEHVTNLWNGFNPTATAFRNSGSYTSLTNSGSSGSTSQRTTVALAAAPSYVSVLDLCVIDGNTYLITAITTGGSPSVEVYPWVSNTSPSTGTIDYIGGGIHCEGGDSGEIGFGVIDATGAGYGLKDMSLYGQTVDRLVTQNCGAGLRVGAGIANSHLGGNVAYFYCENNTVDLIQTSDAVTDVSVASPVAFDWAKTFNLCPRFTDNTLSTTQKLSGVIFVESNGPNYNIKPNLRNGYVSTAVLRNTPGECKTDFIANSATVQLNYEPNRDRLFGMRKLTAFIAGSGSNSAPAGTITISLGDPTWRINALSAGVSDTITSATGPVLIVATPDPDNKIWRLGYTFMA